MSVYVHTIWILSTQRQAIRSELWRDIQVLVWMQNKQWAIWYYFSLYPFPLKNTYDTKQGKCWKKEASFILFRNLPYIDLSFGITRKNTTKLFQSIMLFSDLTTGRSMNIQFVQKSNVNPVGHGISPGIKQFFCLHFTLYMWGHTHTV